MPKMPTLGPQPKRSGSGPVVSFLLLFAAAAFGYSWWTKHKGPVHVAGLQPPQVLRRVLPQRLLVSPGQPLVQEAPAAPALAVTRTAAQPVAAPPAPVAPPPPPAQPQGPRHLAVAVDGPLERAIVLGAGHEAGPALAQVVTRALVWWVSVPGDLRRGDKVDVVYEERGSEEPVVDAVRLVSAKYNRTFQAYRYKPSQEPYSRFYQPDGQELEMRLRVSPLDTYEQITSLIRDGRHHKGVDFKTPVGSPVKATFAGTITRKNWKWRANGNCLELTEAAAPFRKAFFLHLSELPHSLMVGQKVSRGEVIAQSGNTGHSFAPHLHYQLMTPDERVLDPFESQESYHRTLPASEKAALEAQVSRWQALMGPKIASGT